MKAIFDPYAKPEVPKSKKPEVQASFKGNVYTLKYQYAHEDTLVDDLIGVLKVIAATTLGQNCFENHGITIVPRGTVFHLDKGETMLQGTNDYLCINIGEPSEDAKEIEAQAFDRLGRALDVLNYPEYLDSIGLKLIKGGN